MKKNIHSSSPNIIELEDLKILFNKENYDLLEIKIKPKMHRMPIRFLETMSMYEDETVSTFSL